MKKILSLTLCLAFAIASMAQTVTLTFTGIDNQNNHVSLDSIVVTNLTRGWQEVLYYPDTTLILTNNVGIADNGHAASVAQNMPNPFDGTTNVGLFLSHPEKIQLTVVDMTGKTFCQQHHKLDKGNHNFRITLSTPQTYLLHITVGKEQHTIKMINEGHAGSNSITYMGTDAAKGPSLQSSHPFVFGDFMEYVGFTTFNDEVYESARINIQQGSSQTHTLVFPISTVWDGTGLNPNDGNTCAETPVVTDYDGNIYTTVQIGTQCWMRENLKTTHYSDGTSIPLGTTQYTQAQSYRYAPGNDTNNVDYFGYYYNWPAIMKGASGNNNNPSNIQGICPNGWHLPSSAEWTVLTDYVESQSVYLCNNTTTNISKSLSTAKDWLQSDNNCATGNAQGTNNATGFSAKPAGGYSGTYNSFGNGCCFWTCTPNSYGYAVGRSWYYNLSTVATTSNGTNNGRSVRCLKN